MSIKFFGSPTRRKISCSISARPTSRFGDAPATVSTRSRAVGWRRSILAIAIEFLKERKQDRFKQAMTRPIVLCDPMGRLGGSTSAPAQFEMKLEKFTAFSERPK